LAHGHRLAEEYAERAFIADKAAMPYLAQEGPDRRFLTEMLRFVVERIK
jgi:hypothetical protein